MFLRRGEGNTGKDWFPNRWSKGRESLSKWGDQNDPHGMNAAASSQGLGRKSDWRDGTEVGGGGEGGDLWFLSDAGEDGDRRHFAVGWGCREVFEEVLVYSGKDCLAGRASTRSWRSVGRSWGRRMISNRLRESGKCKSRFETPGHGVDTVWRRRLVKGTFISVFIVFKLFLCLRPHTFQDPRFPSIDMFLISSFSLVLLSKLIILFKFIIPEVLQRTLVRNDLETLPTEKELIIILPRDGAPHPLFGPS